MAIGSLTGEFIPIALSDTIPKIQAKNASQKPFNASQNKHETEAVRLSISNTASNLLTKLEGQSLPVNMLENKRPPTNPPKEKKENNRAEPKDKKQLSNEDETLIEDIQQRYSEARTHEQQHIATAGEYAQFEYQIGTDDQQYAMGGHVDIDISESSTPEETVRKSATIKSAAMAPKSPSSADRQIAAKASQMETHARVELQEKQKNTKQSDAISAEYNLYAKAFKLTGVHINTFA